MQYRPLFRFKTNTCRGAIKRFESAVRAAVFSLIILALFFPLGQAWALPSVEDIFQQIDLSDSDKEKLRQGKIIAFTQSSSSDRELVVGKALLLKGDPKAAVKLFREAKVLEVIDVVKGFGEIKGDGTIEDFAGVKLEPNGEKEAERYLNVKPGDKLNLDTNEMAAFQALKGKTKGKADTVKKVEEVLRGILLKRYQAYRTKGLSGIAPYDRGGGKKLNAAGELARAIEKHEFLRKHFPGWREILLKYPDVKAEGFEEKFHWINIEVFSRPTFILSHRMLLPVGDLVLVMDRHFYAGHDYNVLQAGGGGVPMEDGKTLVVYVNRVSTDQVGGFGSGIKQKAARGLMSGPVEDMWKKLRASQ